MMSHLCWLDVAKKAPKSKVGEKVVDERLRLKRPRRGATLRGEVWQAQDGEVTKYNLAYINHLVL
jgi:hypothetical protein